MNDSPVRGGEFQASDPGMNRGVGAKVTRNISDELAKQSELLDTLMNLTMFESLKNEVEKNPLPPNKLDALVERLRVNNGKIYEVITALEALK